MFCILSCRKALLCRIWWCRGGREAERPLSTACPKHHMSWLVSGTYSWSRSRSAASSGASHPIGCLQHIQTLLQGPCYRLLKPVQQCHLSLTSSQTAPCVRKLLRDHKTTFQTLLQRALLQTVQACATTPLQSLFSSQNSCFAPDTSHRTIDINACYTTTCNMLSHSEYTCDADQL